MSVVHPVVASVAIAWSFAALVSIVLRAVDRWLCRVRRPLLLAALALLPVALGIAAAVLLLAPGLLGACHCEASHDDHLHVCLLHPASSAKLMPAALVVLALAALNAAPLALRLARDVVRARDIFRAARASTICSDGGAPVRVVVGHELPALTVGVLSPLALCGASLWRRLDASERRIVALHEQAHALRRDPLTLLALRVASLFTPVGLLDAPIQRWRQAAERAADDYTAAIVRDRLEVAEKLVAVARKLIRAPGRSLDGETPLVATALLDLEQRVVELVTEDRRGRSARASGELPSLVMVFAVVLCIALAFPGNATHWAIEAILRLF